MLTTKLFEIDNKATRETIYACGCYSSRPKCMSYIHILAWGKSNLFNNAALRRNQRLRFGKYKPIKLE